MDRHTDRYCYISDRRHRRTFYEYPRLAICLIVSMLSLQQLLQRGRLPLVIG